MPEAGTTDASVRFLVNVAAEAFTLESVTDTGVTPFLFEG
jgi:hypothetical protein